MFSIVRFTCDSMRSSSWSLWWSLFFLRILHFLVVVSRENAHLTRKTKQQQKMNQNILFCHSINFRIDESFTIRTIFGFSYLIPSVLFGTINSIESHFFPLAALVFASFRLFFFVLCICVLSCTLFDVGQLFVSKKK